MINYKGLTCHALFKKYNNGNTKIELIDSHTFMPVAEATAKVEKLEENEVAIKDHSDHTGVLTSLIEAQLVSKPHKYISSGYTNVPVCRVLKKHS